MGETQHKDVDWGWMLNDGFLYPVTTDIQAAPKKLLEMIKCGCSGNCDTRRCSCRKNGMECTVACKNCKGVSCQNVMNEDIENKNAFE